MNYWIQYDFVWRALLGGVFVGALASYYGVFVVQRRLSFLGSGLAHAAFGGVALGLLLQTEPLLVAVPFTAIVALLINWIRVHTSLAGDTAIGVLFAVSVALGIIFLSIKNGGSADAITYLFGSVLTVSTGDLWVLSGLLILTAGTFSRFWGNWAYATFDSEFAKVDGIRVDRDDYILSILLAVTTVVSIKVVGILLIAAFLVIPAASARMLTITFRSMTFLSVFIGATSVIVGLYLSYLLDMPTGAVIILVQSAIFAIALSTSASR